MTVAGTGNNSAFWWDFLQKYIAKNYKMGVVIDEWSKRLPASASR